MVIGSYMSIKSESSAIQKQFLVLKNLLDNFVFEHSIIMSIVCVTPVLAISDILLSHKVQKLWKYIANLGSPTNQFKDTYHVYLPSKLTLNL